MFSIEMTNTKERKKSPRKKLRCVCVRSVDLLSRQIFFHFLFVSHALSARSAMKCMETIEECLCEASSGLAAILRARKTANRASIQRAMVFLSVRRFLWNIYFVVVEFQKREEKNTQLCQTLLSHSIKRFHPRVIQCN